MLKSSASGDRPWHQHSSTSPLFGCQAGAWAWVLVEGLVQKHGFDSALVSVDWLKMGARIQAREEEVVVAMRAWKLVEEPVAGHWTFVGASEDLLACRSDWVPVVDRNGLPLRLPVAPLGAYSTVQELLHRQLLQNLLGRQLPDM